MNREFLSSARFAACLGVLTILPGAVMMLFLFLGIEPPLGPFREMLVPPADGSTILGIGSFVALGFLVGLPLIGLILIAAVRKDRKAVSDIGLACLIGILVTLPLAALQMTVGRASYSSFPVPLFGLLWLLTALFATVASPPVRAVRNGESVLGHPGALFARALFLILIGVFWTGMVADQMPCFLGVPNCD